MLAYVYFEDEPGRRSAFQAVPKRKGKPKTFPGKLVGRRREWLSLVQQSHAPTIKQQGARAPQDPNAMKVTFSIKDKIQQHHPFRSKSPRQLGVACLGAYVSDKLGRPVRH